NLLSVFSLFFLLFLQHARCGTTTLTKCVNALFEQFIKLLDGATLTQHIPVGTWWLNRLGLNAFAFYQGAPLAVLAQPFLRYFCIMCERNFVDLTRCRAVLDHLAGCEIVVAVGFVAYSAHTAATEYAICHCDIILYI